VLPEGEAAGELHPGRHIQAGPTTRVVTTRRFTL
jgi:hypothetical protein